MRPHRLTAIFLCVAALLPGSLLAQDPDAVAAGPISAGETRADSLPPAVAHAYTLDLEADRFVYGVVDQRTVDVAVTVIDPEGEVVRRFDSRTGGADTFHWTGSRAGSYRIELVPAAEATGSYALRLERVEPVAVDPAERLVAHLTRDIPFEADTRTKMPRRSSREG